MAFTLAGVLTLGSTAVKASEINPPNKPQALQPP